jgi:hypothetical protein
MRTNSTMLAYVMLLISLAHVFWYLHSSKGGVLAYSRNRTSPAAPESTFLRHLCMRSNCYCRVVVALQQTSFLLRARAISPTVYTKLENMGEARPRSRLRSLWALSGALV